MKRYLIVPALAIIWTSGCSTTPYQGAEKTVKSMDATRQEAALASKMVSETIGSLTAIVSTPQEDLRPAYEQFNKQVRDIESQARKTKMQADWMRGNRDKYIDAWTSELTAIQNPAIQKDSAKRRTETLINFNQVEKSMNAARVAYEPFISDLNDIKTTLSTDLTAAGVSSTKGAVKNARANAISLQKSIDSVIRELDKVTAKLSPSS